jgi:thiamine biosynthesis lipoprotein
LIRIALLLACCALAGCAAAPSPDALPETLLRGETMGSAWTVKLAGELPASPEQLQAGLQARFDAVNQALSTWRGDSALSRFNRDSSGAWVDVDPELAAVMAYARILAERSDGAYDLTVGPLVNLWGFGPDPARRDVPAAAAIENARAQVGWRRLEVDTSANRARKEPGVYVDLSSLGKGRGVDRAAEYLDALGIANYLIDLSGKLRAHGVNARRKPWRVAVEKPGPDDPSGRLSVVPAAVELADQSIATAGDYRRFFETGGKHYSHIIDPRTGYPVAHATVSSTVVAADCMQADALATVFMAMTPDAALALADRMQVPALLITRSGDDFRLVPSVAWRDAQP